VSDCCSISSTRWLWSTGSLTTFAGARVTAADCVAVNNFVGFHVKGGEMNVVNSMTSNNAYGFVAELGGVLRITNSAATGNGTGAGQFGAVALESLGNNMIAGSGAGGDVVGTITLITPE
jgi:hypothetical protein